METTVDEPRTGRTFDDFVAARSTALWRSAYLLTGDRHKAEDLLQTALVKTWRRWDRLDSRSPETAESYVRRALVTTYTDWWRRRWRGEVPTEELPDGPAAVDETARADVRRDVLSALAGLTRGQRAVLVLRYFDDLTEQQTADTLGISTGTVKSQTSRAIAALRSSPALTDRLGDLP